MSSIADLRVIKRDDFPAVAAAYRAASEAATGPEADELSALEAEESYWRALDVYGRKVEFDWSGYVLFYLWDYLESKDILLGKTALVPASWENGDTGPYETAIAISPESKVLTPRLAPGVHDPAEVATYFAEMGYGYERAGADGLAVLALLRTTIDGLADDEVLLVRQY